MVTKSGVVSYLNLMTWEAVAKPCFDQAAPSLPIAGGTQTLTLGHTVFSVCVHPSGRSPAHKVGLKVYVRSVKVVAGIPPPTVTTA